MALQEPSGIIVLKILMAVHNDLGKAGEELAVKWLTSKGYTILHQNWKWGTLEIDVIAKKGKFLYFIEVKTRNYSSFGHPEDQVSKQKFRHMQLAANGYLTINPNNPWIEYQILAITIFKDRETEYFLIEDVYLK
jgi:putative endonuclease